METGSGVFKSKWCDDMLKTLHHAIFIYYINKTGRVARPFFCTMSGEDEISDHRLSKITAVIIIVSGLAVMTLSLALLNKKVLSRSEAAYGKAAVEAEKEALK